MSNEKQVKNINVCVWVCVLTYLFVVRVCVCVCVCVCGTCLCVCSNSIKFIAGICHHYIRNAATSIEEEINDFIFSNKPCVCMCVRERVCVCV